MKTDFDVDFQTSLEDVGRLGFRALQAKKEKEELYDAFDVLQTWQSVFEQRYGHLRKLSHHSNPDDPPDVTAHFDRGDLEIEHTWIEAQHVKQSEVIHKRERPHAGCNGIPLSGVFTVAEQKEIMWTRCHPRAWENCDSHIAARLDLIENAVARKLAGNPRTGLLILKGDVGYWGELETLGQFLASIAKKRDANGWTFILHNRLNSARVFSVIVDPQHGSEIKK